MAFVGFAVMNPQATMAMLDGNRWRTVVYADTPRCIGRYNAFLKGTKKDTRKAVLFLLGASQLSRVNKDLDRFSSVFIFDDVQNLHHIQKAIPEFEVVDIDKDEEGEFPRHLSPAEIGEVVASAGSAPKVIPLITQLTNALGKRKPSVLEMTSRMPMPEAVQESGSQRMMAEIKLILDATESTLPFAVVLDTYTKFLFRLLPRSKVTSQVTKKLGEEAKDLWGTALDLANSDVGLRMAYAFRSLCETKDPDYRVGHAVSRYGLKPYSGDFLYFTAILHPNSGFEFLSELTDAGEEALTGNKRFVPPAEPPKAKKKRPKKA